jgi:hypothetical protein
VADGFALIRVLDIKVEVAGDDVVDADFPRLIVLFAAGKTVGFIAPPVDFWNSSNFIGLVLL